MRRMTTTKQLELLNYLSKGIKVNNYPEEIKIDFPYNNMEELDSYIDDLIEEEALDLENHTCDGCAILYYHTEEYEDYISLCTDDSFEFPETINTKEAFANWLINNLPINPYAYIEELDLGSGNIPNLQYYDFDNREYEFINGIIYLIGYNASQYSILDAGIDTIHSNKILVNTLGSTTNYVAKGYITSIDSASIKASTKIEGLQIQATGQLYGQLGLSNRRSDAYINNGDFKKVLSSKIEFDLGSYIEKTQEEGINIISYGDLSLNSDSNIHIGSNGNVILTVPSTDPHVAGAVWADNGVLKISSGS